METEHSIHNECYSDLSNGYRIRKVFGHKQMFELQIPRTHQGSFYPIILGLLKNQQEETNLLAFNLYRKDLMTEQVGEKLYDKKYSISQGIITRNILMKKQIADNNSCNDAYKVGK